MTGNYYKFKPKRAGNRAVIGGNPDTFTPSGLGSTNLKPVIGGNPNTYTPSDRPIMGADPSTYTPKYLRQG